MYWAVVVVDAESEVVCAGCDFELCVSCAELGGMCGG